MLAGVHLERTAEGKLSVHSLGEQDARSEPSPDLVRDNDSAHGRTDHNVYAGRLKAVGETSAYQCRVLRVLEEPGALNVLRTMSA